MSKKCFWVSEELPSDGQRSEINSNIENIESGVAAIRKMSND